MRPLIATRDPRGFLRCVCRWCGGYTAVRLSGARYPLFPTAAAFPAGRDSNEPFAFAGPQTVRMLDALKDTLSEMAGAWFLLQSLRMQRVLRQRRRIGFASGPHANFDLQ